MNRGDKHSNHIVEKIQGREWKFEEGIESEEEIHIYNADKKKFVFATWEFTLHLCVMCLFNFKVCIIIAAHVVLAMKNRNKHIQRLNNSKI